MAAIVLAGGMTACGDDDETSGGGGDQTVKVGGIFDLSGATADVGTPYADGIKGFVKNWNAEGDGPKIELISEDYKYDVAVAERLYSRLKSEGVVAVQGWGTGDTEALRGKVTADRKPFMSASYAETLTKPAETPFNFVAATSYSDQMRIALKWIAEESRRHRGRLVPSRLAVRRVSPEGRRGGGQGAEARLQVLRDAGGGHGLRAAAAARAVAGREVRRHPERLDAVRAAGQEHRRARSGHEDRVPELVR